MKFRPSFVCKASSGLLLTMLAAAPAVASDFVTVTCVDVSTSSGVARVLELAATPVNEKYFSLAGSHKNAAGQIVGSAVGTALVVGNELITTVNASSVVDNNAMEATLYQFNFNLSNWKGPFQGITQQSSSGSSTPSHKSGQAALLLDCNAALTVFEGSQPQPEPTDCTLIDNDRDGITQCRAVFAGFNIPYDCDDNDPTKLGPVNGSCDSSTEDPEDVDNDGDGYSENQGDCNDSLNTVRPGATEICGDGIDQDCSGADLSCSTNTAPFVDNGNETITQTATGRIWQKGDYYPEDNGLLRVLNWQEAVTYCNNLVLGGADNWRLPSIAELESLVDTTRTPTISALFNDPDSVRYWSATDYSLSSAYAYAVNFENGSTMPTLKTSISQAFRCVR